MTDPHAKMIGDQLHVTIEAATHVFERDSLRWVGSYGSGQGLGGGRCQVCGTVGPHGCSGSRGYSI